MDEYFDFFADKIDLLVEMIFEEKENFYYY